MNGNDIIDLSLAETESNWKRKGFLEKQFTDKEKQLILKAENSFIMVWKLWSMKESSYKIYVQKNDKRFFAPKKFECKLTSKNGGLVSFQDKIYYTNTLINTFFIHTIANSKNNKKNHSKISSNLNIENNIKKKLEKLSGFSSFEIHKKKTKNGVPNFYFKDILLTKSCSISHHGNYGAFSLLV